MKRTATRKRKATRRATVRDPDGTPATAKETVIERADLERAQLAWHLLWSGTLALLEGSPTYALLMAKLRRHGLVATSVSMVANPAVKGRMTITLRDHERPEPYPEMPRPPSDATLTKLRAFAGDRAPVRLGRPRETEPVSVYLLYDWARRHLPHTPGERRDDRALAYIQERLTHTTPRGKTVTYSEAHVRKLMKLGRREWQKGGGGSACSPLNLLRLS